ncbi:DNA-binding transcriptional regulator, GntR family [Saccharopolyspora antimicrobica]|uniref:DNA-binding GntR family transcriptional regulator n=1 Tax=Saccharopolyspora antimicrobica TaxID=455193 RepID=A0A1I5CE60_9PSEU|nr:GntR family transcriptional regulator [Saccharopolyspora antimicrobica]RKT88884.1 DNA-binding GntR family transcriptional regulator [Saccharopolyspora antimicrobica]SFN85278.1 DNA-binding transcriptional regulator, GntR family [Saccharopolyspora antimicrobica]
MTTAPQGLETPPTSLAERAYAAIQDQLIMLDIPPLAPIDDLALSESLGIGRTPVREALKRLEVDRLVVSYPRRGTFATGVDITDLAYISEIRVQLEPLAARRAADNAAKVMRTKLTELADTIQHEDVMVLSRHELMRWDLHVHRSIYRAAGNPHLEDTLVRYNNLATRIFCVFLERITHFDRHVEEHVGLLQAVAAGEGRKAEKIARDHVTGFEKAIRAII